MMTDRVKLLYVDDERGNIDYFRSVFRREYEVVTANSGEEGLAILAENYNIPVILTDQRMPRMTGIEFLRKSISMAPDSIRILVTGFADMDTVINAINLGHVYYYISKPWSFDEMNIIISRAIETYLLRIENKELLILSERKEKERIITQLENLRNQVNPHFLFNCLNTLHTLVTDNEEARVFIKKLSSTYRYLLEHRHDNLVVLSEELNFVENFIHLQKVRFKDSLTFSNEIVVRYQDYKIPYASLQLIVENTIKHNIVRKENPLNIELYNENEWLVVKNNYQPKQRNEESTGVGQENLTKRLSYLTSEKPKFYIEDNFYFSKIPLLKD